MPEDYERRIGRVRAMIAGTEDYDHLTREDRAAIREVFQERTAFMDACTATIHSANPKLAGLGDLLKHLERADIEALFPGYSPGANPETGEVTPEDGVTVAEEIRSEMEDSRNLYHELRAICLRIDATVDLS